MISILYWIFPSLFSRINVYYWRDIFTTFVLTIICISLLSFIIYTITKYNRNREKIKLSFFLGAAFIVQIAILLVKILTDIDSEYLPDSGIFYLIVIAILDSAISLILIYNILSYIPVFTSINLRKYFIRNNIGLGLFKK